MKKSRVFAFAFLLVANSPVAQVETGQLEAAGEDRYGFDLVLREDVLFVGAPGDDEAAEDAGAAHVYYWDDRGTPGFGFDDEFTHLQKLIPPGLEEGDSLGTRIDGCGDVVVMSAIGEDSLEHTDAGAVYIAQRDRKGTDDPLDDEWIGLDRLTPSSSFHRQRFGQEIVIQSSTIAVGVRDDTSPNDEKVFVFERDDRGTPAVPWDDVWIETAAIPSMTRSRFGWGIELVEDALLVGARWHDLTEEDDNSGAVFVYYREDHGTPERLDDTWFAGPVLTPDALVLGGQYGRNLEASGDTLVIGAWRAFGTGAAYVLERDRMGTGEPLDDLWIETALLQPSDGRVGDAFGNGVTLSQNSIAIGSFAYDHGSSTNAGKVYVYARDKQAASPRIPSTTLGPRQGAWSAAKPMPASKPPTAYRSSQEPWP